MSVGNLGCAVQVKRDNLRREFTDGCGQLSAAVRIECNERSLATGATVAQDNARPALHEVGGHFDLFREWLVTRMPALVHIFDWSRSGRPDGNEAVVGNPLLSFAG